MIGKMAKDLAPNQANVMNVAVAVNVAKTTTVGTAIIVAYQGGEIFPTTVVMKKNLNHIWLILTEFVPRIAANVVAI